MHVPDPSDCARLPPDVESSCQNRVSSVLLGGPGGQGTRVEVSPDTSRA